MDRSELSDSIAVLDSPPFSIFRARMSVYTMNLDRLSLLRPLASDGRTRKNALSASARLVDSSMLECGRWGTAQHGMLACCAERGRSSTKCWMSRWDPTFCTTFSRLCRKRAKMGPSGPPFGAPFGSFCANSCVFEIPRYHIFPLKKKLSHGDQFPHPNGKKMQKKHVSVSHLDPLETGTVHMGTSTE